MHFNRAHLNSIVLIALFNGMGAGISLAQAVLYVSTGGSDSNDGLSWAAAKQTVQAGLGAAVSGDQVWVAAGTYVENVTLAAGVGLYGGFAGTETSLAQRDWVANETILDGNRAGSVVTTPEGATETTRIDGFTIRNGETSEAGGGILCGGSSPTIANNVITENSAGTGGGGIACGSGGSPIITNNRVTNNRSTDLGFSGGGGISCFGGSPTVVNNIVSGNISGSHGGGIYCYESSPTIANNTIAGNAAWWGGGIHCDRGTAMIVNNAVTENTSEAGGGIYCANSSSLTIADNAITGNSASQGGGIFCSRGPLVVARCVLSGNWAEASGGGVNVLRADVLMTECVVNGNSSHNQGGGVLVDGGEATLSRCRFVGNSAGTDGGAILNGADDLEVTNCLFSGNWAFDFGGAVSNVAGDPRLTGCAFVGNYASWGAGLENWTGTATLVNCSFALNEAFSQGNDVYGWNSSQTTLANSIAWSGNATTGPIVLSLSAGLTVRYSNVRGGPTGVSQCPQCPLSWEGGNIDADPLFADTDGPDDVPGTRDDSLRVDNGSPCIDAGSNADVPADAANVDDDADTDEPLPLDLAGWARFLDDPETVDTGMGTPPIVDMGAYEFHAPVPGDFDGDEDVDGDDLEVFEACATGPAVPYNPAALPEPEPGCTLTPDGDDIIAADFDSDGDVDQSDFGALQRCLSGASVPANPHCGG